MTDVKKFHEFMQEMEWEGGLEGIILHGHDGSGDAELDDCLEHVELAINMARRRISKLSDEYGEYGEEDNE